MSAHRPRLLAATLAAHLLVGMSMELWEYAEIALEESRSATYLARILEDEGFTVFGAASVAGAIAIKRMMEERGTPGTVRLYGTPAEETVVGKVYMARGGLFDDLDAAIVWHPGQETEVSNNRP